MGQVRIGREFFQNARKDYRDANWAWVREIMQNSIDAPDCDRIDIRLFLEDGNTTVVVENDGQPMTEEVLVDKLLTLGASGKRFAEQDGVQRTGGFGKAKELLYFCQLSYQIATGGLLLTGEGGEYDIQPNPTRLSGTRSVVVMEGDVREQIEGAFRQFCQFTQWSGTVTLKGERLATNLKKGSPRRDFDWAKVYTNRSFTGVLVVRINGTPMFTRPTAFKGCVVVELSGNSGERLSANRDSLLWSIGQELDAFLIQLAVDKRSALRQKRAEVKRYEGERLRNEAKKAKVVGNLRELLIPIVTEDEGTPGVLAAFVRGGEPPVRGGIATEKVDLGRSAVSIGPEFFLQNTTGMVTPDYYTPGEAFSSYSRKLALAWAACLLELHKILDIAGEFSIGFILDEDCMAQSAREGGQQVYYVNPATVVAQRDKPQCRSFRAAFTGAWADRFALISLALHELVHGAFGLSLHDEEYSSKLTEVTGVAMAHLGRLTPLFRS